MIEHRWDSRVSVPVNVVVHTDDGEFLKSFARNISRGGIFIEAEDFNAIEDKKMVWVEFIEDEIIATIPAYVLRYTERTAALMFITHPQALHSYINHLFWIGSVH